MTRWIEGGAGSLVKLDKVAYKNSQDYWQWQFLQAMNEAFCGFLTYKNVSIGCYPHTRLIILLEELQSSKCLWEDLNDEKPGTLKGHTKLQVMMHIAHGHKYGAAYNALFYLCLVSQSVNIVEYILLLYASWCCFFQADAVSYAKQVVKLMDSGHMAGKVTVEINEELMHPIAQHCYIPDMIRCCHHMLL
ncbi:5'-adenylylsulfate reductase 1, chloroplastic-like [Gastrolobium bilobum]|uniref:5'-adenylylsulfate reductase 1, chloroplastic-like n=1 Tax=Gastrolobium bilobum TaxID=150636 RepID=UPI002AB03CEE|nr:5'-adenylylsulfate reductase 1, chloroplastic-like [Gastrolobium bilobum]XP_061350621.1 5'-adenylylsulfate reductase 1, chloroplastic-like [Gastrolobium bilobum]